MQSALQYSVDLTVAFVFSKVLLFLSEAPDCTKEEMLSCSFWLSEAFLYTTTWKCHTLSSCTQLFGSECRANEQEAFLLL